MKHLASVLSTVLVLAAPLATMAQNAIATTPHQLQPNEHALNVPGATTIDAPPAGFDPLSASDEDLAYYGFPPRPSQADSSAYATWVEAMQHSKTRVFPVLEQTNIYNGPAQITKNANPAATENNPRLSLQPSNTLYSANWSGYVDFSGATKYGTASYYFLENVMVVPVAQQKPGTCSGGWEYGSQWNGIDGWGSSDVLQAGVEFDAYCSGSTRSTFYSAWYEWYPYSEVRISSLPVIPGDDVFVEVWHTSATQGYAYLVNYVTGKTVQVGFTAYPGHPLIGNSAEWIVEAPTVGGKLATMTDYTRIPFWNAFAYTENDAHFYDMANGNQVDMKPGSTVLSSPQYLGSESFVMSFQ